MTKYLSPRHGVSLSQAQAEAAAIAPAERAMLNTFELYHPVGTPGGPIYGVNDYVGFTATKEANASRDAGLTVDFLPISMQIARPEESNAAETPEVTLTVGGVSGVMSSALRVARGSLVPWELTERVYASDDPSAPAIMPPTTLYLKKVDMDGATLQITASLGDSVNVSVPRLNFNRNDYPGLTGR